ncbi:LOW QUALITY PROTEIN: Pol protein [Phytophthora palmivora]|uniref:Pol protein n=1 Tax=Phytophthora palmivora TaxID=4796 RepID=A0A2P4XN30_9STRA|nr:LOW QUALITY PROTEIN: Pol protein [Phytophthora palmivora]
MRVLAASLVGNPLPEHVKVAVFMDGLKVGPSRTQLFRVYANTMEVAIQIALQEEYSHRQARTPTPAWQGHNASTGAVQEAPAAGASTGTVWVRPYRAPSAVTNVGSSGTCNVPVLREGKGSSLPDLRAREASGKNYDLKSQGNWGRSKSPWSADGAHHGGLAPESLGALETRKSSGGLLVVHASVRGYGDPFRVLIDSGASTNFARRQTVARNGDKYADALRESKGRDQVSVRLADDTVVEVPRVRMDLAVKFEDFDSTESFLVLDMDKYDLILGMPWHEPLIDWRGKAMGASRPAASDRALVSNVPTSVRDCGARDGRQGALCARRTCGIATTASPNAKRRAIWASTVVVPDGTGHAGNIGPQAAEAAEESADGVPCVINICPQAGNIDPQAGNVVPQAGNIGPQAAEAAEEDAKSASGVGNIVPHKVEETKKTESAAYVSSVGKVVPRGVKKTRTRADVRLSTSRVDNHVPHSESETPPAWPIEEQYHVFDGVSSRQVKAGPLEALPEVSALLNLEELLRKDFLAELKAAEVAEMVILKPETSTEDLNSSSVMDEDVLEGFTKQRATRLGSEILRNPEDPVYPLVKEYSDVVSKHQPPQLPPDREVRHEIDLVPGAKYYVTRQWPLPREQCEVIDAFFAEKAKSGMVRESKSPHSAPTFCVRKPNGKWRLVHAYNKLNNATVPAQTPIPRKDVLLNNMSGCTLYSALDLVDGYYQILMGESDIPLTAMSTPSGMLWEWLVMPQGLSNALATFNRLVTQLFRPLRTYAQTYFDDIFVHSRAEGGQTVCPGSDGYYQILMGESDIPLTAMSTPSGMLWEWLVMPQGLSNECPSDVQSLGHTIVSTIAYVRSDPCRRWSDGYGGAFERLRLVFEVMRANKLYANIDKCVFAAEERKVLSCFVSRIGVRADPGKVKTIAAWPTPRPQKDLRKWLGLANYLHKYRQARPLSDLLKKDADWVWERQHQDAFDSIKASLQQAPVLALPDENKSLSVVCDASDYAIGCALLKKDSEGRERVITFRSRQLKAAERN